MGLWSTTLRRFFVYACAFTGASWFGWWLWDLGIDTTAVIIVLASLAVAWLFAMIDRERERDLR